MRSGEVGFQFMTHCDGLVLTTGIVVDRRGCRVDLPGGDLPDLADLANSQSQACAYGKIAIITDDGIHAFQVMPDGRLSPAFCGNSTAAAIRCMAPSGDLLTRVHGPSSNSYAVTAKSAQGSISQTWHLPKPVVEEIAWHQRKVLVVRALNDYAIVIGGLPQGIAPEQARTQLLGEAGCGKLAVVETGADLPLASFFNTNGRHGAAPQTGLASLSIAAMSVGWFGGMLPDRRISYMTRIGLRSVFLPGLSESGCGNHELEIGPIDVDVTGFEAEIAA
jgi:hypothetical protein